MNVVFEKSYKIVPDKFILKLRDNDVVKYCESKDDAFWTGFDEWSKIKDEQGCVCKQSWTPDDVTCFVKDGKSYKFFGFLFEKDGEEQPRHFFLYETDGK